MHTPVAIFTVLTLSYRWIKSNIKTEEEKHTFTDPQAAKEFLLNNFANKPDDVELYWYSIEELHYYRCHENEEHCKLYASPSFTEFWFADEEEPIPAA